MPTRPGQRGGRNEADAALEEARSLPPGPERIAALKRAGLLRRIADGDFDDPAAKKPGGEGTS